MMKLKKSIFRTVTVITVVAVLVCAIIIISKGSGLVEGYDFGAGAYYYADIPEFEKIIDDNAHTTAVPRWIHILIFLIWGWLMYRLWIWIDRRKK